MIKLIEKMKDNCTEFRIKYDYYKSDMKWELHFTYNDIYEECEDNTLEGLINFVIDNYDCFKDLKINIYNI